MGRAGGSAQVSPCPPPVLAVRRRCSRRWGGRGTQPEPSRDWVHEHFCGCVHVCYPVCGKQKARRRVNYPGNISKIQNGNNKKKSQREKERKSNTTQGVRRGKKERKKEKQNKTNKKPKGKCFVPPSCCPPTPHCMPCPILSPWSLCLFFLCVGMLGARWVGSWGHRLGLLNLRGLWFWGGLAGTQDERMGCGCS